MDNRQLQILKWTKHERYPSVDDDSEATSFGSEFKSASCTYNKASIVCKRLKTTRHIIYMTKKKLLQNF